MLRVLPICLSLLSLLAAVPAYAVERASRLSDINGYGELTLDQPVPEELFEEFILGVSDVPGYDVYYRATTFALSTEPLGISQTVYLDPDGNIAGVQLYFDDMLAWKFRDVNEVGWFVSELIKTLKGKYDRDLIEEEWLYAGYQARWPDLSWRGLFYLTDDQSDHVLVDWSAWELSLYYSNCALMEDAMLLNAESEADTVDAL